LRRKKIISPLLELFSVGNSCRRGSGRVDGSPDFPEEGLAAPDWCVAEQVLLPGAALAVQPGRQPFPEPPGQALPVAVPAAQHRQLYQPACHLSGRLRRRWRCSGFHRRLLYRGLFRNCGGDRRRLHHRLSHLLSRFFRIGLDRGRRCFRCRDRRCGNFSGWRRHRE